MKNQREFCSSNPLVAVIDGLNITFNEDRHTMPSDDGLSQRENVSGNEWASTFCTGFST